MAITVVTAAKTVAADPWLITKIQVNLNDSASTAITHGGPALAAGPDLVLFSQTADATANAALNLFVTARGATTITLEAESEGAVSAAGALFDVFCVWFAQKTGGIS